MNKCPHCGNGVKICCETDEQGTRLSICKIESPNPRPWAVGDWAVVDPNPQNVSMRASDVLPEFGRAPRQVTRVDDKTAPPHIHLVFHGGASAKCEAAKRYLRCDESGVIEKEQPSAKV
jgi:hypothetical protein